MNTIRDPTVDPRRFWSATFGLGAFALVLMVLISIFSGHISQTQVILELLGATTTGLLTATVTALTMSITWKAWRAARAYLRQMRVVDPGEIAAVWAEAARYFELGPRTSSGLPRIDAALRRIQRALRVPSR